MKSSSHLLAFKYEGQPIMVEIITTNMNTTAYQIQQTQGAEFGAEAENMRKLFEAAPDMLKALQSTLEAMRNLLRQIPNDDNLADYRLDQCERAEQEAIEALKKAGI